MLSLRAKLWLDLIGTVVLLIPVRVVIAYMSRPIFTDSWFGNEVSTNTDGLIRWPFKILLPTGYTLVTLQDLSRRDFWRSSMSSAT